MVGIHIERVFVVLEVHSAVDIVALEVFGDICVICNFVNDHINASYPFDHHIELLRRALAFVYLICQGDTVHIWLHVSPYLVCHALGYLKVSDVAIVALVYVQLWCIIAGEVGAVV